MTDRPPTMQDVARAAGVKISRVRQYFSDSGMKINQAALSLGYLPEIAKNAESPGNHKHIAVITPFSTAYSFNERIRGVMNTLSHRQYEVVHYHVETIEQLEHYLDSLALSGTCEGIILMSLPLSEKVAIILKNKEIPLVSIERLYPGSSGISVDNTEGGRLAARYLLKRGYKKPAFMGDGGNPEYAFSASALRLHGFEEGLEEARVPLTDARTILHKLGADFIPEAVAKFIESGDPPDCLFCASDLEAIVVMKTAKDLGLQIPGDLAVLGFDNIELSEFLGLSTVDQFLEKSGRDAALLLVDHIDNRKKTRVTVHYDVRIKERSTT